MKSVLMQTKIKRVLNKSLLASKRARALHGTRYKLFHHIALVILIFSSRVLFLMISCSGSHAIFPHCSLACMVPPVFKVENPEKSDRFFNCKCIQHNKQYTIGIHTQGKCDMLC